MEKNEFMADDANFKAGDFVVYPTHGVGKVEGVENREIAGEKLRLIVVLFDRDRMTLRIPVAEKAQPRKIAVNTTSVPEAIETTASES